ncbi:MAG: sulfite exporter TauE/SafE family protein [Synergistaceae bacterium]|nr:sulfite exporter TauE/SafE family protein [Synergistaceae bacterium]
MDFLSSFTGLDLPLWGWLIVLTAGAGIGIAKTAVPGSGILVVVLMAMALPSRMSVGVLLPMLLFGDVFAVGKFWRHTDRRQLFTLLPFAFLGLGAGYMILRYVTNEQLKPIIGAVVLFMLGVHQVSRVLKKRSTERGDPASARTNPLLTVLFGFASGLGTGMANSSGPIMSLYFLIVGLPKLPFIATTAWFFFIMNLLKVPLFLNLGLISSQSLRVNLLTVPSIALGALLGYWIVRRISQERFNQIVLGLAFVAALRLLF